MRELRPGLWHWQGRHPDWEPSEPWDPMVSSYAIDDGKRVLLIDPIAVPEDILALASDRDPVILLTAPWHERDARNLVERLRAPVYTPPPDSAEDLMRIFGITAEQAGEGSPDVRWLRDGEGEAHWYSAGDRLPVGAQAFPGHKHNDVVLWIESRNAVVSGDTLGDFGEGLGVNSRWLRAFGVTREQVVDGLRPLLDLPVELVLPAHGAPTDRGALERALA